MEKQTELQTRANSKTLFVFLPRGTHSLPWCVMVYRLGMQMSTLNTTIHAMVISALLTLKWSSFMWSFYSVKRSNVMLSMTQAKTPNECRCYCAVPVLIWWHVYVVYTVQMRAKSWKYTHITKSLLNNVPYVRCSTEWIVQYM